MKRKSKKHAISMRQNQKKLTKRLKQCYSKNDVIINTLNNKIIAIATNNGQKFDIFNATDIFCLFF